MGFMWISSRWQKVECILDLWSGTYVIILPDKTCYKCSMNFYFILTFVGQKFLPRGQLVRNSTASRCNWTWPPNWILYKLFQEFNSAILFKYLNTVVIWRKWDKLTLKCAAYIAHRSSILSFCCKSTYYNPLEPTTTTTLANSTTPTTKVLF